MGPWPRERRGNAGGARVCKGVHSRTRMQQRKGGRGQTSSGRLGGVAKSIFDCSTWELGRGKSQKHLGCCQTPDIHKLSGFLTSLPSPVPPYSPLTCPLLSKNSMADYKSGLREPEAPAMQIQALHCCLCSQPHTPLHPLAPPAFPPRSLGHGVKVQDLDGVTCTSLYWGK